MIWRLMVALIMLLLSSSTFAQEVRGRVWMATGSKKIVAAGINAGVDLSDLISRRVS